MTQSNFWGPDTLWERAPPAIRFRAGRGIGYLSAGPSAVGNSRRVHRDVLNVSRKGLTDPSRGTDLTFAAMGRSHKMVGSSSKR